MISSNSLNFVLSTVIAFYSTLRVVENKTYPFLCAGENDLVNWKKRCEARNAGATADEFPEEREVCKVNGNASMMCCVFII